MARTMASRMMAKTGVAEGERLSVVELIYAVLGIIKINYSCLDKKTTNQKTESKNGTQSLAMASRK